MKNEEPSSDFGNRTFASVRGLSIVGNSVSLTPEPQAPIFGTVAKGQDTIGLFNDLFKTNAPSLIKEAEQFTQIQIQKALEQVRIEIQPSLPEYPSGTGKFVLVYDVATESLAWLKAETCE